MKAGQLALRGGLVDPLFQQRQPRGQLRGDLNQRAKRAERSISWRMSAVICPSSVVGERIGERGGVSPISFGTLFAH
jgi:hypothetical protein